MTHNEDPEFDSHGRSVSYLRLSVTDRCNLRCRYCRSKEFSVIPHSQVLSYEEMITLAGLSRRLGVDKVRLTGGEPMVRRDFLSFVERLMAVQPDIDLRITTNGTLLPGKVATLKSLGVKRLNISLDTMIPEKFAEITGRDAFHLVRQGIDEALGNGVKVKLNVVAMRGVNDDELPQFVELARQNPLDVRFIEFMPMGGAERWTEQRLWPAKEILRDASRLADLTPLSSSTPASGPARIYTIDGGLGRLGVISPVSDHFCATCNRLRVTSDGKLRTCLFSEKEYRLAPILRNPKLGVEAAYKVIRLALARKPLGYKLLEERKHGSSGRLMSAIGG